ncbi:hypothetical protein AOLI_G00015060, partial [Acnodon oligacanthus]
RAATAVVRTARTADGSGELRGRGGEPRRCVGGMERYRRAVRTDCERLLGAFQATDSVRYEEFSAIWRRMNFSSVFHGRMELSETRAFTRSALSVASPYLFPPYTFQIRVGGLYVLYGLYNTQLTIPKEKIRLALKDWNDLVRFQQDAVNAQHYDVVYILRKLLSEKAFYFTAMPNILFFNLKGRRGEKCQKLRDTFIDRPTRPQELISTDMVEELANVHEHYEKLKQAVSSQPDTPDLSLIKQNLVPRLHSAVFTYCSWQQSQAEFDRQGVGSDAGAGEGTSCQESCQRAQLLQSIKSRCYGEAAEACRSRRHRQVELTSADTDMTTEEVSNCKKVLSLKERTQLRFMSQGNLNKDLTSTTKLWCLTALDEKTEEKKKRRFTWESDEENPFHRRLDGEEGGACARRCGPAGIWRRACWAPCCSQTEPARMRRRCGTGSRWIYQLRLTVISYRLSARDGGAVKGSV